LLQGEEDSVFATGMEGPFLCSYGGHGRPVLSDDLSYYLF